MEVRDSSVARDQEVLEDYGSMSSETAFPTSCPRAYKREYAARSRTPDIETGARGTTRSCGGISGYGIRVVASSSYSREAGNSYAKGHVAYSKNQGKNRWAAYCTYLLSI